MKKNFKNSGFMMVEVLVAISIMVAAVLAAMAVSQKSVYVVRQAFHTTQATFLLEEGAEAVRILRDNNWANISGLVSDVNYYPTFSGNTWTLSQEASSVGIFTRTVSVANVNRDGVTKDISVNGIDDPGTRLVTVTVSWMEGGNTVIKTLQFYILNIFS